MWQHAVTHGWQSGTGGDSRLRVLIETDDPVAEISDFTAFREAGLEVALCSGPTVEPGECPLVRGEACPLVDEADAVLVELDVRGPRGRGVVQALVASHPRTPIVVACSREEGDDPVLPAGVVRLPMPASVSGQVRVVRGAAVDGRRASRLGLSL